jgi:hypothetical protein
MDLKTERNQEVCAEDLQAELKAERDRLRAENVALQKAKSER